QIMQLHVHIGRPLDYPASEMLTINSPGGDATAFRRHRSSEQNGLTSYKFQFMFYRTVDQSGSLMNGIGVCGAAEQPFYRHAGIYCICLCFLFPIVLS
ncbi:hypothetical protein, partial [Acidisphaera sp. S103]|uniref:hypothetical protein n=1 Tax=Acidisphaera sp. S103 TaxID=1747223 RepID=UPI001C203090